VSFFQFKSTLSCLMPVGRLLVAFRSAKVRIFGLALSRSERRPWQLFYHLSFIVLRFFIHNLLSVLPEK
ncbi:MAG: hypothetical protein ACI814_000475, partial [Mariniblastus sp.]